MLIWGPEIHSFIQQICCGAIISQGLARFQEYIREEKNRPKSCSCGPYILTKYTSQESVQSLSGLTKQCFIYFSCTQSLLWFSRATVLQAVTQGPRRLHYLSLKFLGCYGSGREERWELALGWTELQEIPTPLCLRDSHHLMTQRQEIWGSKWNIWRAILFLLLVGRQSISIINKLYTIQVGGMCDVRKESSVRWTGNDGVRGSIVKQGSHSRFHWEGGNWAKP